MTLPRRKGVARRRATPRRRDADRWDRDQWAAADLYLQRRAGGRCECCGNELRGRAERHHRTRRRDGGDRLANLLLLLPDHHRRWTENPAEAVDRGIIVPTWADPAATPVLHRGRTWLRLADDGSTTPVPAPPPGQTPVRTG